MSHPNATADAAFADRFFVSSDGLRLHARDYGKAAGSHLPAVCLPGLARTARDFHELALHLATDPAAPRRVVVVESRGRGRSAYDPNWQNYDVRIELGDLMVGLDALGLARALFVGTSRGGLLTMALASARPGAIGGVVLNDIGPVIEPAGLQRIAGYVGKLPEPQNWRDAAAALKRAGAAGFPALGDDDWRAVAEAMWREDNGRLVLDYDPAIGRTLEGLDAAKGLPSAWPLFDALPKVPLMVLRGENSDILSAGAAAAMAARRPGTEVVEVRGQGHAPVLRGALLDTLARFARRCDAAGL
jgi:pimeloyl-ACP methyl ester carboxylesterase